MALSFFMNSCLSPGNLFTRRESYFCPFAALFHRSCLLPAAWMLTHNSGSCSGGPFHFLLSLSYKRGTSPSADRITSALSPCRTLRQKLRWKRISPFHRDRAVPRPSGHQTAPPPRIQMREEMDQGAGLAFRSSCTCSLLIRYG